MHAEFNEAVPHSGTVVSLTETDVTIQIAARLGMITVPLRLVISDDRVKVGDTVYFSMSMFEVFNHQ